MNILGILVQEAEAAEPSIFSLNLGVSFWTVVIFLILLGVLAKYAFPPILGYANAREQRIQEILDAAARDRAESERLLEEQRRHLAAARQDAQRILGEARDASERVRQELLDKARTEQEEVLARARQDIERERERAIDALRREAVELSLAAAAKLVGERVGDEEDRALVRAYLDRMGAGSGVGAA